MRTSEELFASVRRAVKTRKTEETGAVLDLISRTNGHPEVTLSFR